jgi:hypothetical protein
MNGCTYSCTMKCRVLACGSRSTRWRCDLWHICIAVHMQFKSPCVRLAAFYLHVRAVARVLAWLPSCSSRRSRHVRAVARQTSLVRDFVQPCNSDRLDNSHIDRPVGLFLNRSHTTCVFLFRLAFRIGKRACKSVAHTPCSYQHRMWSYRVACYGPDPTPE